MTDHLRHDWTGEVVSFPVEFQRGECDGRSLALTQAWDGKRVPCQLVDVRRHPGGGIQHARLAFIADLPARQSRTWRLEWGHQAKGTLPETQMSAVREQDGLVLSSGVMALRVPARPRRFLMPVPASEVPAPILAVKGPDGQWRGRGWLESPLKVKGYETAFLEDGPVLKAYQVTYRFAGDKNYSVTFRLFNGLTYAHVTEEAQVDKTSRFVFSIRHGFEPTHLVRANKPAEPVTYSENSRLNRFFFNNYFGQVSNSPPFDFSDWIGFFREEAASRDYLAFVKVHGGSWTSPFHNAIHFVRRTDPDLRLESPLRPCRREWLVALLDRTRSPDLTEAYGRPGVLTKLCVKVGYAPLDEVKDMALSWPSTPKPRPLTDRDRDLAKMVMERLARLFPSCLTEGPYGLNQALNYGQWKDLWPAYGFLAGTGALAEEDERFVRAAFALLAYLAMDRDFFAWYLPLLPREDTSDAEEPLQNWRYNFYMMNTNFDACRFTGVAEIALSLRDHPDFKKFIDHFKQCLKLHLENVFSEDGFYHEAISYKAFNLFQLTFTAERLKREIGLDVFDEPRLKKGYGCLLQLATPPDPRYGGALTLPRYASWDPMPGVTRLWHVQGRTLLASASDGCLDRDPELAGALSWLFLQTRSQGPPPQAAPKAPVLTSQRLRGWGAVLRTDFGTDRESYVLFRCDPFVGRYLNMENSFYYYARGRPLLLNPHDGFEGQEPFGSLADNRISFNGTSVYEHWWGQLGHLEDFQSLGPYGYVRGFVRGTAYQRKGMNWMESVQGQPHAHRRHLLNVRGDYLVLADEVECEYPTDFTLHALADGAERENNVVHVKGRYEVDMNVHFLSPALTSFEAKPTVLINGEERLPMLWLHATAAPNQPYLTVLAPFARGIEPPKVQRLLPWFAARIEQGESVDYVFLSPVPMTWASDTLRFEGVRGILRTKPRTEITLLEAGKISNGKATLRTTAGGVTLAARADGSWEGQTCGDEKSIAFSGAPLTEMLLDGKKVTWEPTVEDARLTLPQGPHHLLFR
ncbi:MAG: hypothetical protein HYU36_02175 [Planctomycetes bacterium]|nr:hypothetical protein [Planctomycetota bacterium]